MWSHRKACLVIFVVLLGLVNMGQIQPVGQRMFTLLTPQEAAQLRLTEEEWQPPPRTRALSIGPRIIIKRPPLEDAADGAVIETISPTRLWPFGNRPSADQARAGRHRPEIR